MSTMDKSMERFWVWVSYVAALAIAWWAGLHNVYQSLLIIQTIDVATGVLTALKKHRFRSAIGLAGLRKKLASWLLIFAVATLQQNVLQGSIHFRNADYGVAEWATLGLIAFEFTSIIENVSRMGVVIPPVIITALNAAKRALGLSAEDVEK